MNLQTLDESFQLVLVVTTENVLQMPQTLDDVQTKSLHPGVLILASDTPFVRDQLSGVSHAIVYTLPPTIGSGCYWASVVSAHQFESQRTIFLQAGTRVPEGWDARLVAAGQRASTAFAISPQSAQHPLLSVFGSTGYQPELSVDEIDQWLNDYVDGVEYTVPVILESCALLQGDYWRNRAAPVLDDPQLLAELRGNGACLLATDQLYVDDFNTNNNISVSQLPKAFLDAFALRPPLARVHHALSELSRRREKPPILKRCLPVQLHVGHSWGGGLGRWMEDFIAADTNSNHLVLRSIGDLSGFGQTLALYRSTDFDIPIKSWALSEPIISINLTCYEYQGIIDELVAQYNVESIVVSSLIGHSLDVLRTSFPTTVVLHDFFPFCPALYATFGSPCVTCTSIDLRTCAKNNPRNSYFKYETQAHWLAIRREFVHVMASASVTAIAPSQSVVDRYRQLESSLSVKVIHVVAHGLDSKLAHALAPALKSSNATPSSGARLKIVMLGRLTEEKGGELLADTIDQLETFSDIYLLGTGESGARFSTRKSVIIRECYDRNELGELLQNIQPDLGMLLSTVPETFSYTLSEMWAAGIPVLATRLGAFVDRIHDSSNGWLIEPNAAAVLEKLHELNSNRDQLARVRARVAQQSVRTSVQMVSEYATVMPKLSLIPIVRYNLPRRTYRNPYGQALPGRDAEALSVNHQMAYRQVLSSFLRYTARKMQQTPRFPDWIRGALGRSLYWMARHLDR